MRGMDDEDLLCSSLAQRLGLTQKGNQLEGILGDASIRVAIYIRRAHRDTVHAPDHERVLAITATLPFYPPLDTWLQVKPIGSWEALNASGRTGFVRRFSISGRESDRAAALLDEPARDALDQSFVGDPGPQITDQAIIWRLESRSPWPTIDAIAALLLRLPPVWSSIVAASLKLRPPSGVEAAFVQLAGMDLPSGLELRGCPAGCTGHIGEIWLSLTMASAPDEAILVSVVLVLPTLLLGAPQVVQEERFSWLDRALAFLGSKPEITLGDDTFDARFAVRSLRPDLLEEVLDAETRAAMLALDAYLPVHLDAKGIKARATIPLSRLGEIVGATVALARTLSV